MINSCLITGNSCFTESYSTKPTKKSPNALAVRGLFRNFAAQR